MTQEDKQLLLQDICGRLPYGIYANLPNHHLVSHKYYIHECNAKSGWTTGILICAGRKECYSAEIEDVQPYLRPLSSMTEEERDMVEEILGDKCIFDFMSNGDIVLKQGRFSQDKLAKLYDYYNSIHVDYRGLIPKGLAIAVTKEK